MLKYYPISSLTFPQKVQHLVQWESALRRSLQKTSFASDDWRIRTLNWARIESLPELKFRLNYLNPNVDVNKQRMEIIEVYKNIHQMLLEVEMSFWTRTVDLRKFTLLSEKIMRK